MARTGPWLHGLERLRLAPFLTPRARLHEAVQEAESSLQQFSGIETHSQGRGWFAAPLSVLDLLGKVWWWVWSQGPAAWVVWSRGFRSTQSGGRAGGTSSARSLSAFPLSWPRLVTHLGLLGLLTFLLLGGAFQGVLAQPVQANEGSFTLAWQLGSAQEIGGIGSAYDDIPAVAIAPQPQEAPAAATFQDFPQDSTWLGGQDLPEIFIPERDEVITYTVQSGDSLTSIAAQFGLHMETLYWYNGMKNADQLSIDQKLRIPPLDGLVHKVEEGDSLDSIAEQYEVRKGNMIAYAANDLREPYTLFEGQEIFVPGAYKEIPRPPAQRGMPSNFRLSAPSYASLPGGERFSWPAAGRTTDRFGWTGSRWHAGLDIAAPWGTPIYAAAGGTVSAAGWKTGYGYTVWIDHGDGWQTRYGHMAQQPEVSVGQWVDRGQLIGFIGCTGWCTGPHVHFEVRYQGNPVDPLNYL